MRHPQSLHRRATYFFFLSLIVISLGGWGDCDCDDDPAEPAPPGTSGFISSVAVGGSQATYHPETLTTGVIPGPLVVGAHQIVARGSLVLEVTVEDTATELYFTVDGATGGYYGVDLTGGPAGAPPATAAMIAARKGLTVTRGPEAAPGVEALVTYYVTITSSISFGSTSFIVQVGALHGQTMSALSDHAVTVNPIAQLSDHLQVSLNFTQPVDLDLHLEVPGGTDLFFANPTASGGVLDLDSNPACFIDGVNNENITWDAPPPAGVYKVRVNLWSACDLAGPFAYAVTVNIGGVVRVYEGNLSAGQENAGGSGTLVNEFTISTPL